MLLCRGQNPQAFSRLALHRLSHFAITVALSSYQRVFRCMHGYIFRVAGQGNKIQGQSQGTFNHHEFSRDKYEGLAVYLELAFCICGGKFFSTTIPDIFPHFDNLPVFACDDHTCAVVMLTSSLQHALRNQKLTGAVIPINFILLLPTQNEKCNLYFLFKTFTASKKYQSQLTFVQCKQKVRYPFLHNNILDQ